MPPASVVDLTPSASRLTTSLRDIGYDFQSAIADLVDNSVSAAATQVDIDIVFDGADSYVSIADDGCGMSALQLDEALRFGTRRSYRRNELGRYGLGLKTASISQCRSLTVITRQAPQRAHISRRTLDLDHIQETDRWEIIQPTPQGACAAADDRLSGVGRTGTVIVWNRLDRVLPPQRPDGGWARRRFDSLAQQCCSYLGMVFHRFIEGGSDSGSPLTITVNGEKVRAWDPFATDEEHTLELPAKRFEVATEGGSGAITLRRFVLPPRDRFSSLDAFERMSGPLKWNRQQGFYIYRADRLIQCGGWAGIRAIDEHTKFARASLEFDTDLDDAFHINVAKMRASVPSQVRTLLEKPVHELCHRGDAVYRREASARSRQGKTDSTLMPSRAAEIGSLLLTAAMDADEMDAFERITASLRDLAPDIAQMLGL